MDAWTRFDTRVVGGLPVIVGFLEKLGLAACIDEMVPCDGDVALGTLVEILVLNRLLAPTSLFRIGEWAEQSAVADYYGLTASQLNDDRMGRALERLHQYQEPAQASVVAQVVKKFKVDVSRINYDITTVELFGSYTRQLEDLNGESHGPLPKYGKTKSGRKNVKQIQLGLNVAGDGAVPLSQLPLDGNASEIKTHTKNWQLLNEILPKPPKLYVADSKLDSPENLLAIAAGKGKFLCGGAFRPHLKKEFRKLRKQNKFKRAAYCPASKAHLPEAKQPKYEVAESVTKLEGIVDGRPTKLSHRLIYVWSEAKAEEERKTRERHIEKIKEEFEKIERNLNKFSLITESKIHERLEKARAMYDEGAVFKCQLRCRKGKFTLKWSIDQGALDARIALEGGYVLKTNLPKSKCSAGEALHRYREQSRVEQRIRTIKGPLAVAPMFLEKPERMGGMLVILVWAAMIIGLMERGVRRSLKGKPMYGLYPENRPSPAPTATAILNCFANLCIVIVKHRGDTTRRLAELSDTQRKLIKYMGIPPGLLKAFKRKCCQLASGGAECE